mgnify:CR=1 FL=1
MIIRRDFLDTSPYFIHPSAPAPLGDEAGAHHEARMLEPGAIIDDEQAERMAEIAAARRAVAGGDLDEMAEARGVFGIPLAVVFVVAMLAAIAHVVAGGA